MSTGDILNVHPSELKFSFELRKQSSCSVRLTNKTNQYVAFKVKTTNLKKYCVRPNKGIVLPGSTANFTVTMRAQKEAPSEMQCRDRFLVQSVLAPNGATTKDITSEMFNVGDRRIVAEFKLRVVYVLANTSSPVAEGSKEGSSPTAFPIAATRSFLETLKNSSSTEAWSMMCKLTDEKASALQRNQKLQRELEQMRRESRGFSLSFVALIGLLGFLVGYFIKA